MSRWSLAKLTVKSGHKDIVCSVNKLLLLQHATVYSYIWEEREIAEMPRNWLKKET